MYKAKDKHGVLKVTHASGKNDSSMRDRWGYKSETTYFFPIHKEQVTSMNMHTADAQGSRSTTFINARLMLINKRTNRPAQDENVLSLRYASDGTLVTNKTELVYAYCLPMSAYSHAEAKRDFEKFIISHLRGMAGEELCTTSNAQDIKKARGERQRVERLKMRHAMAKAKAELAAYNELEAIRLQELKREV